MSTDISDLVPRLKRAVAVPGTFGAAFPNTADDDLIGSLEDAYGESQLDGFFLKGYALDLDLHEIAPDLSPAEAALLVLYSGCAFIRAQLANLKNRIAYQAGNVKYETEQGVRVLADVLKSWETRKQQIIDNATATNIGAAFAVADQYFARAVGSNDVAYYDTSIVFGLEDEPYRRW